MRPEDEDLAYVWDMREAAREIVACTNGVSLTDYETNGVLRRAVERMLEIIGEAAGNVSSAFRETHQDIPWSLIVGQRNVLAHNYGAIIPSRIHHVAVARVPKLLRQLDPLLPPAPE